MSEHLERAVLDSDENGFTLVLETDESPERCRRLDRHACDCESPGVCKRPENLYALGHRIRVGYEQGRDLLDALRPLRDWIAEGDRERAAYDAATPDERAVVLGLDRDDPGYDPDDPKHPDRTERVADTEDR